MPTYQYACTQCDHRFEAVQSFSEDSLAECPECTGRLRKVYSSVGVMFKGSGFYHTDNRTGSGSTGSGSNSGSSENGSNSADSSGSSESSSSSSESGSSGSDSGGSSGSSDSSAKTAAAS